MSYRLRLYPYCGGHDDLIDEGELTECRRRASRRIRHHRDRMEYPVTILERGRKWEMESDPDGGCLISDFEGILVIVTIVETEDSWTEDDETFEDVEEGGDHA
jgi:hypothetical protein